MKKTPIQDTEGRMKRLLNDRSRHSVLKGEIWIGSAFLARAGFEDTIDNHFRIAEKLGQDIVCLPVSEKQGQNDILGYRYFEPKKLHPGFRGRTRCLAVVIDGPFQRMVNQQGLMAVLMGLTQESDATLAAYGAEQKAALALIDRCLEKGVDAVVLADDVAGDQAPLINPRVLDQVCTPFYTLAVASVRAAGAGVFLHCCGNLEQLLPMIASWDLDGLAAIQTFRNDMALLDSTLGGIFIAGIDATLLEKDSPSPADLEALKQFVGFFAGQRRLILCSSCGLYRPDFWGRLQRIYEVLEKEEL